MRTKCGYCKSDRAYLKMATSKRKKDSTGWLTKRYFICSKCQSITIDIDELDNNQKYVKSYTETYLKEDIDYSDINEFIIDDEAVCYEKKKEIEDNKS